jgi:hypothetical protein
MDTSHVEILPPGIAAASLWKTRMVLLEASLSIGFETHDTHGPQSERISKDSFDSRVYSSKHIGNLGLHEQVRLQ